MLVKHNKVYDETFKITSTNRRFHLTCKYPENDMCYHKIHIKSTPAFKTREIIENKAYRNIKIMSAMNILLMGNI